jgi:hypothetical protein
VEPGGEPVGVGDGAVEDGFAEAGHGAAAACVDGELAGPPRP